MKDKKTGLPPQHSPRLKMIADEIAAILEKNDVAGVINILEMAKPGAAVVAYSEVILKIDPSWSCVKINKSHQLEIMPPIEDPQNPAPAKQRVADTVNMLANIGIKLGAVCQSLGMATMQVRQRFGMVAKPGPNFINGKKPH